MSETPDAMATGDGPPATTSSRRSVLGRASQVLMGTGLVAAYGTFAGFLARFLYPTRPAATGWMFVAETKRLESGAALLFETPSGSTVNVARQGGGQEAGDFIALSSTCPHLGCQVHWEAANGRFFCPCHNGAFDPAGRAIAGPPAEAGQSLPAYPLMVRDGLLFMEVPQTVLAMGPGRVIERGPRRGAGHDPCLGGARPCGAAVAAGPVGSSVASAAPAASVGSAAPAAAGGKA